MSDRISEIASRGEVFNEEAFLTFVAKELEKFKKHAQLVGNPDRVTLADLNRALAEYSVTEGALLSMLAVTRLEARRYKEDFEDWFSKKYLEIRKRENRLDLTAQKWLGQKEIERMVRVEYSLEFKNLKKRMDMTEYKKEFISRILKGWENHQFILNQISKNIQTQVSIGNTGLSRNLE